MSVNPLTRYCQDKLLILTGLSQVNVRQELCTAKSATLAPARSAGENAKKSKKLCGLRALGGSISQD
jgi:hypothetical protein